MSKKYEYLISYAHDSGFGNAYVTLEQKINKWQFLSKIGKEITKDNKFKNEIIILNFTLLGEIDV